MSDRVAQAFGFTGPALESLVPGVTQAYDELVTLLDSDAALDDVIQAWTLVLRHRTVIYQSLREMGWNSPDWGEGQRSIRRRGQIPLSTASVREFLLAIPPAVVPTEAHTLPDQSVWVKSRYYPYTAVGLRDSFRPLEAAQSRRCLQEWHALLDRLAVVLPARYLPIVRATL